MRYNVCGIFWSINPIFSLRHYVKSQNPSASLFVETKTLDITKQNPGFNSAIFGAYKYLCHSQLLVLRLNELLLYPQI